jgi:predicted GNAT family N-acyltransferase
MESSSQVVSKTPSDCSAAEIAKFIALVTEGGEVAADGLEQRVMAAARLAFLLSSGQVTGVAALKSPNPHYRGYVASASGVALPADSFPYELGWVFLASAVRGKGHSQFLSQAVLAFAERCGVFATSRNDNTPMHRTLAKLGFLQVGEAYASQHGEHLLQLFTRVPRLKSLHPSS